MLLAASSELQRERGHTRALADELEKLESEASDLQLRNDSLEALVQSLMGELMQAESRRSRERERVAAAHGSNVVPLAAIHEARDTLEDGAAALVAVQEHTLRTMELRLAEMSAQLDRCASVLPCRPAAEARIPSPTSPSREPPHFGLASEADTDWAEPGLGGLSLDSLPLHVPTHGSVAGTTGGAYGIHGRRAAISTHPWSEHPGALDVRRQWWSEHAALEPLRVPRGRGHHDPKASRCVCLSCHIRERGGHDPKASRCVCRVRRSCHTYILGREASRCAVCVCVCLSLLDLRI